MGSAASPLYWCHQCHVQTRPDLDDEILCTFCNGGFVEELDTTDVEPGVAFSSLPVDLGNLFRYPSPSSVGTGSTNIIRTVERLPSLSDAEIERGSTASGRTRQAEPENHRPRVLSGQHSELSSLFRAMLSVLDQSESMLSPTGVEGVSQVGQEEGLAIVTPTSAILILQGGMANALRGLEVPIDDGQGLGPQMLPGDFGDYFIGPELDRLIEILSENDPNRYGTPPASKSAVKELPKVQITEEHVGSNAVQCAVCKDNFEPGDEGRQMPCKHLYHTDCILPWLALHNSCPVCRFELPTEDADYEARKNQTASNSGASSNEWEGQETEGPAYVEDGEGTRQFTLWAMPGIGFDESRLSTMGSNERTTPSDSTQEIGRNSRTALDRDAAPISGWRVRVPVPWLFRLLSSSILPSGSSSTGRIETDDEGGRPPQEDSA